MNPAKLFVLSPYEIVTELPFGRVPCGSFPRGVVRYRGPRPPCQHLPQQNRKLFACPAGTGGFPRPSTQAAPRATALCPAPFSRRRPTRAGAGRDRRTGNAPIPLIVQMSLPSPFLPTRRPFSGHVCLRRRQSAAKTPQPYKKRGHHITPHRFLSP
jgi:hypothetical protein